MKEKLLLIALSILITVSCTNKEKAASYYLNAVNAYNSQNFTEALDLCNKSLKENPKFLQGNFLEAKIFFFTKDYDNSIKTLKKLYKQLPSNLNVIIWYVKSLFMNENYSECIQIIDNGLKTCGDDYRLYYWKALAYRRLGDFENYFIYINLSEKFLEETKMIYLDLCVTYAELGLETKSQEYRNKYNVFTSKEKQK